MLVDLSDWRHHELLARGVYEPHVTGLLQRISNPGWTVIDVGANVGYFAALASHLGGAGATVHAFEPHPQIVALAEINARLNDGEGFTVVQAACGARTDRLGLHLASIPGNIGDSTLVSGTNPGSASVDVDVVRLDEYCRIHDLCPDLVKIDVEGFELQVLEGMANLLRERVPAYLVIEVGGGPDRPSACLVVDLLAGYGYEPQGLTDTGEFVSYVERVELQDVCFVRGANGPPAQANPDLS